MWNTFVGLNSIVLNILCSLRLHARMYIKICTLDTPFEDEQKAARVVFKLLLVNPSRESSRSQRNAKKLRDKSFEESQTFRPTLFVRYKI